MITAATAVRLVCRTTRATRVLLALLTRISIHTPVGIDSAIDLTAAHVVDNAMLRRNVTEGAAMTTVAMAAGLLLYRATRAAMVVFDNPIAADGHVVAAVVIVTAVVKQTRIVIHWPSIVIQRFTVVIVPGAVT
jgi:hypothetical protein